MDEHLAALLRQVIREELAALKPQVSDVLSTKQAAEVAGVAPKTVNEWILSGGLPAGRRGRLRTIRREDLERFLAGSPPASVALLKRIG